MTASFYFLGDRFAFTVSYVPTEKISLTRPGLSYKTAVYAETAAMEQSMSSFFSAVHAARYTHPNVSTKMPQSPASRWRMAPATASPPLPPPPPSVLSLLSGKTSSFWFGTASANRNLGNCRGDSLTVSVTGERPTHTHTRTQSRKLEWSSPQDLSPDLPLKFILQHTAMQQQRRIGQKNQKGSLTRL